MPIAVFAVVTLVALTMQAAVEPPRRLGKIAARLSIDDIVHLERLAGGRSWLLIGHRSHWSNDWWVEVYRPPAAIGPIGPILRRGLMVWSWTTRSSAPAPATRGAEPPVPRRWTNDGLEMSWAQVALPGRAFDDVRSEQDLNRPFRIFGGFRDTELVSLVEFIRSGPAATGAGGTRAVDQTLPIAQVERRANGLVDVQLPVSEWELQIVTVRPAGDGWSLEDIGKAIVD